MQMRGLRRILQPRGVPATLVFGGSLGLYLLTRIPAPGWLDDTLMLANAWELHLGSWVNVHNLFNLLGHLAIVSLPFLDPHQAVTGMCALLASLAVLGIYSAGRELTGGRLAPALGAAALAMSQSLWWHATVIEVYSLNSAIIALFLFLVFRWSRNGSFAALCGAFFAAGLGVSNHLLMGLFVFAFATLLVMACAQKPGIGAGRAFLLVACTLAGASLYIFLFMRSWIGNLADGRALGPAGGLRSVLDALLQTFQHATGVQSYGSYLFATGVPPAQRLFWYGNYLFLLLYNFPSAALLLGGWGIARFARLRRHRAAFVFFAIGLAAQMIWSSHYFVWDMYAFSLPVYVMFGVPVILGVDALLRSSKSRVWVLATLLLPLAIYPAVASASGHSPLLRWYVSLYPDMATPALWDPASYVLLPIKRGYRVAETYCRGLFARLPAGAHLWDDDGNGDFVIRYYYRLIRGEGYNFVLHSMFSYDRGAAAQNDADEMRRVLESGQPVYVSSLLPPAREVLAQLFHAYDPGVSVETLRKASPEALRGACRSLSVSDFPLDDAGSVRIYRIDRKE